MAEEAPPYKSRVLPDGSNDVIVDLSGDPRPFVVGAMRQADIVPLAGRIDLVGVRFRPGGAVPFLGVPLHELTDRQVALDVLWGNTAGSLGEALAEAPMHQRVAVLERHLLAALPPTPIVDDLVQRTVALLQRTRGGIGIRAAAQALGVGERRLERAFDHGVGLTPKRFSRVVRFLRAVRDIGRRAGAPGAAAALDAGYSDQPHFIREFRRLAGVTPAQYVIERRVGFVQDEDPLPA
jgi:AraC-like DNA-binding protein